MAPVVIVNGIRGRVDSMVFYHNQMLCISPEGGSGSGYGFEIFGNGGDVAKSGSIARAEGNFRSGSFGGRNFYLISVYKCQ